MPRGARGKGLRAIRHAAFTLGLLAHCRSNRTPHPGFVIFDSLLLAYRESDGKEDDLRGTELKEQFYRYLQELTEDRQVIVEQAMRRPKATQVTGFRGDLGPEQPATLRRQPGGIGFFSKILTSSTSRSPVESETTPSSMSSFRYALDCSGVRAPPRGETSLR